MLETLLSSGGAVIAVVLIVGLIIAGAFGWYIFMKARYRTVQSNEALIVTGPNLGDEKKEPNIYKDDQGRYMKVIRGGGHRLKMFQTGTRVSLTSFQLHIKTPKVYTAEGVGIYGEAVATIKVADKLEGIVKYAEQFLGKDNDEIEIEISEVLNSNLRAILSKMTVEQINGDRESFNREVTEIAQKQLNNMGFQITSLGLSDIRDDDQYLVNLGRPQIAKVKQAADIAESVSERETQVKQAEDQELIQKEQLSRQMSVAESQREKDLKDSAIRAETDTAAARASAAGQLEEEQLRLDIEKERLQIKEQERRNDLHLLQLERENNVKLEEQEVAVRKQKADADAYEKLKRAEADAEAAVQAGNAEAEVTRLVSLAEVEAIERKAAAMDKHKEVIIMEKMIEMMPDLARAIAEPMGNVDSIRILDGGSGDQLNSLTKSVTNGMINSQEIFDQMLPGMNPTDMLRSLVGLEPEDGVEDNTVEDASFTNVDEETDE